MIIGEVQLAGFDAYHDPNVREGLGESICTKAMARGNCRKWQRIIPKAIVHFQRDFQKSFSSSGKYFVLSPNKKQEPPRPKTDLG